MGEIHAGSKYQPEKSYRMCPSPMVEFEVSTVKMLQNTKTAPVSAGLKSFVGVARSGEKVTKYPKGPVRRTTRRIFLYFLWFLPLSYIQQVNGECCSGAPQRWKFRRSLISCSYTATEACSSAPNLGWRVRPTPGARGTALLLVSQKPTRRCSARSHPARNRQTKLETQR